MTDPKNTEDQELSLDQLKDAAGGISPDAKGNTTGTIAAFNVMGSGVPVETFTPEDKQKVVESLFGLTAARTEKL